MDNMERILFESRSQPRMTTIKDLPQDVWGMIMEGLSLLEHYMTIDTLIAPHSRRASSFPKEWVLTGFEMFCLGTPKLDSNGIQYDHSIWSDEFYLNFFAPGLGKEQEVNVNINYTEQEIGTSQVLYSKKISEFASDKGLLIFSLDEYYPLVRQGIFVVLNPVNKSFSVLPPLSCKCNCPSFFSCSCKMVPLKLAVKVKQNSRLTNSPTTFYKAYIFEGRKGRNVFDPLQVRRNLRGIGGSWSFRISIYDSMTGAWSYTGLQWHSGSECQNVQIFPMESGTFYICASYYKTSGQHYAMYKFQNGVQVAKVKSPYTRKPMLCRDHNSYNSKCACISSTFFEDEGEIFFFKQTSWIGDFGPNCISATIWKLEKKAMVWHKLPTIPLHKMEVCSSQYLFEHYYDVTGVFFKWNGMLLVATNANEVVCIAAFNISKKTWCKVPENFLTGWSWEWPQRNLLYGKRSCNAFDLDSFVFQPNVHTRA